MATVFVVTVNESGGFQTRPYSTGRADGDPTSACHQTPCAASDGLGDLTPWGNLRFGYSWKRSRGRRKRWRSF
jgi:hypothetical protein